EERLRFLVEDAGVSVLIRGEDIDEQADAFGEHVVVLGRDARGLPGTETHDPEPVNAASDLVYMIYTSGSTGRPKGVRVNHRNLLLSTHARTLVYGGPPERFLLLSSFAFDSSVAGIFWTLSTGGALVLPPAGTQRDPVLVDQLIARWKVTHTLCLASHWAVLLSRGTPESFASLHTSVVSGEVFSTGLIELHDELTGGARLFNEYGPTEDTVWSTVFDCHSPFAGNRVPIGRAIPGTRVYVLNDAMQLAPIGSPGELYLGGKGVAQGYHNRPDRTAHAFVPDPFRPGTGARLYRSGDRVRMLSDGNLEFLGRFDDQVKLRGYRIELGEIEAVLGQMDELREAAVLCRESTAGDKHLVAYFSTRPGRSISARVLRERLGEKLPEYMVPSAFVELPELPRTPIGKLETEALPAPTSGRADLHESFVAPRNAVESVLAMIFEDVLERDEVGVHDDFFDLGGHSILAGRIVYHIREQLGAELPLRALFESPTIEGLATILRSEEDARRRVDAAAEVCLQVLEDGDDA
ncbi:MAG TPA: amino acid adenylation domain-containing protein, partial [Planctomycetes bacterium]|nr:amino acid adenylation domain-containing protein [Planctomycetota bacterium]